MGSARTASDARPESLKPRADAYQEALQRLGVTNARIWIVGDSLQKDLLPAAELGAKSIWARYGHVYAEKNFATLLEITHWSEEQVKTTYDTGVLVPNHIIDSFSQLLDIVDLQQGELF